MYCTVKNPDGTVFEGDSRHILKQASDRAMEMGYLCRIGTECEFYLFQNDENAMPTMKPFDYGSYADIAPLAVLLTAGALPVLMTSCSSSLLSSAIWLSS